MFAIAAKTLAAQVRPQDLDKGCLYPPLTMIREVSVHIAKAVAEYAYKSGLATEPKPKDMDAFIRSQVYVPTYPSYA